jgi:hypothetical protein
VLELVSYIVFNVTAKGVVGFGLELLHGFEDSYVVHKTEQVLLKVLQEPPRVVVLVHFDFWSKSIGVRQLMFLDLLEDVRMKVQERLQPIHVQGHIRTDGCENDASSFRMGETETC